LTWRPLPFNFPSPSKVTLKGKANAIDSHSGPEYSHRLTSKITIAARAFIVFALAVIAFEFLAFPTHPVYASSGSLSLGTVATPVPLTPCPGNGWYSYVNNGQNVPMNCFTSTVQNCPDAQDLSLTFGYLSPAGIIPGNVKGVIVFLNGGNGTQPEGPATGSSNANEFDMIDYDFRQGYEVVQLAWQYSWEQTSVPSMGGPSIRPNVQDAACRPATFLNYVYTNIYQSVAQSNATAGMCAQGDSAGSAAVVYSMTYYGAASYLDNVELISGPVLSDIKQGCEESAPGPVAVCPTGQYGCQLGTGGSSWSVEPTYLTGASGGVRNWTDDQSCAVRAATPQAPRTQRGFSRALSTRARERLPHSATRIRQCPPGCAAASKAVIPKPNVRPVTTRIYAQTIPVRRAKYSTHRLASRTRPRATTSMPSINAAARKARPALAATFRAITPAKTQMG
jgi:hypothetical protein